MLGIPTVHRDKVSLILSQIFYLFNINNPYFKTKQKQEKQTYIIANVASSLLYLNIVNSDIHLNFICEP
jgi:hypothetical protein